MASDDLVTQLFEETISIRDFLLKNGEASYSSSVDNTFRKVLLLAVASKFELQLTESVQRFVSEVVTAEHPIYHIVERKAVKRQYHAWFEWEGRNANKFFSLFGDRFKTFMAEKVKADPFLDDGIQSFLELGNDRNLLVHGNFANVVINKTSLEIFASYQRALPFVEAINSYLNEFCGAMLDFASRSRD